MPSITRVRLVNGLLRRTIRYVNVYTNQRFLGGLKLNRVVIEGSGLTKDLVNFTAKVNSHFVPIVIVDIAVNNTAELMNVWFVAYANQRHVVASESDIEVLTDTTRKHPKEADGIGLITVTIDTESEPVSGDGVIEDELIES